MGLSYVRTGFVCPDYGPAQSSLEGLTMIPST